MKKRKYTVFSVYYSQFLLMNVVVCEINPDVLIS